MDEIIKVSELCFNYKHKKIYNKFKLNIYRNTWTCLVGSNGSGKSTLVRLLLGLLKPQNGIISIDGMIVNIDDNKEIRKKIGVVFENPDNYFVGETVIDNLVFPLENLLYTTHDIDQRLEEIIDLLSIQQLKNKTINELSSSEKQLVSIAIALIHKPEILILDEAFSLIPLSEKQTLLKIIKSIQKELNLTIIQVTHSLEEVVLADRLLIMNNGKIVVDGKVMDVLMQEKIINKLKLKLPFMVDLSLQLKTYNLLGEIELDMDKMVMKIWK